MTIAKARRQEASAEPKARGRSRRHVLDLDSFSKEEISELLDSTEAMREVLGRQIRKVPALRGKTIVTMFWEPSTRTRASFEQAGKILSADVINITGSESSTRKGESLVDTARTLEAMGADVLILRHSMSGAPYLVAQHTSCSVINGGDGWHAHPSQALLDLYTIRQRFGRIEGLKVVIVGDVLHSRVARSNVWGLLKMEARVTLCGPPTLLPQDAPAAFNPDGGEYFRVEQDLDAAIKGADVVMALRLQKERQEDGLLPSVREYVRYYQLNEERLARANPSALVMHPGPMNEGVEISHGLAHGSRSLIEAQVRNGVAVRMALLYMLAAGGGSV